MSQTPTEPTEDQQPSTIGSKEPGQVIKKGLFGAATHNNPDADNTKETELTPELQTKLEVVRQALATKYEKYGAKPEDFNLVTFEREGKPIQLVMLTTLNGLDLNENRREVYDPARAWDSIMEDTEVNNAVHTLEIDGVQYDDRVGMTLDAYKAFVDAQRVAGHTLPDSNTLDAPGGGFYIITWLTGSPELIINKGEDEPSLAPMAWVPLPYSDQVDMGREDSNSDDQGKRFRPAVEV
jgi:hypothetical protein